MVTWGRAFRAAGAYVGFSIVWIIVGGIIISVSYVPLMLAAMMGKTPGAEVIPAIVGMIIGYVIILLGVMAAFFKILPEVVAEEVKK